MSTPNPLIPQGSLQSSGTSNVRIAVATVLAIHVVFFGGLLLQGCKRDTATQGAAGGDTNTNSASLSLPPIDTNSLYYPSASSLPQDSNTSLSGATAAPSNSFVDQPLRTNPVAAVDPWKQTAPATAAAAGNGETLTGKEYTVVRGDTYARIAKTQGSTVAAIKKANPTLDPTKIRPGMKLIVPAKEAAPATALGSTPDGTGVGAAGGTSTGSYTVKAGDTLTKIAKINNITVGQLRAANNLRTSRVTVGQKLKLPSPAAHGKTAASNTAATPNPTF